MHGLGRYAGKNLLHAWSSSRLGAWTDKPEAALDADQTVAPGRNSRMVEHVTRTAFQSARGLAELIARWFALRQLQGVSNENSQPVRASTSPYAASTRKYRSPTFGDFASPGTWNGAEVAMRAMILYMA